MSDQPEITDEAQDMAEWEGKRYAKDVRDILQEREQPMDAEHALDTLATLDAEHDITAYMDTDEVDVFLDEFEEAFDEAEEKHDKIEDAADGKKKEDATDGKKKEDADDGDAD